MAPTIRVAVCTNRPPAAVAECLAALAAQSPAADVLLVASGLSEDEARGHAGAAPAARVLREPRPGLSLARNRALEACDDGDVIAFVDDDAIVAPDWLEQLADAWIAAPARVACIGGPIRPRFESPRPVWLSDRLLPRADRARPRPGPARPRPGGAHGLRREHLVPVRPRCARWAASGPAFGHTGARVGFSEEDEAQRALVAAGYGVRTTPARWWSTSSGAGACAAASCCAAARATARCWAAGARGRAARRCARGSRPRSAGPWRWRSGAPRSRWSAPCAPPRTRASWSVAGDPAPAQTLPHDRRGGARGRRPALAAARADGRGGRAARARLGAARPLPRRDRDAARGAGARRRRRGGAAHRRAGRPRPQRQPVVRVAGAGGGARGGRARGAAPAQLPARVRGGDVLHARRGLRALPRPRHLARRAARVPGRSRRGRRVRRRSRRLAAPAERARRRVRGAERVRAGPSAGPRRAGGRPRGGRAALRAGGGGRLAGRPGSPRARRGPPGAREGRRRGDRGVRRRRAAAARRGRRARGARAAGPRRGGPT